MGDSLRFNRNKGVYKSLTIDGRTIEYRSFEDIEYCAKSKDAIQKLNIFVPERYYQGDTINGYSIETAPIFCPNTVGGYMAGPRDVPGIDRFERPNSIFEALSHGYVVCSIGVRGRNTGTISNEFFEGGKSTLETKVGNIECGKAPAFVVDMKAGIRYLRYNRDVIPGNTDFIITNGTSAGGALSALIGASGNCEEYKPYLEEIGALEEADSIFAASCYCPIHNLEHADMAYEWQFNGVWKYERTKKVKTENGLIRIADSGEVSNEEKELSCELKALFPAYVNSLDLGYTLDENGQGTFLQHIVDLLQISYEQRKKYEHLAVQNSLDDNLTCMHDSLLEWKEFVQDQTRMKSIPAFDSLSLSSPENEEFGDENVKARHFTNFSYQHGIGEKASEEIIQMMNPIRMLSKGKVAKHWRIRHGSFDRDTSLAIPTILKLMLEKNGQDVDFFLPWGLPHSGDYDLPDLFSWIDQKVKEELQHA